jgi:hypothetical protein
VNGKIFDFELTASKLTGILKSKMGKVALLWRLPRKK